jgi:hypothetical protein
MAKSQLRSNREPKKPKKAKPKEIAAAAPSTLEKLVAAAATKKK